MEKKFTTAAVVLLLQAMLSQFSMTAQPQDDRGKKGTLQDTLVLNTSVISASSTQSRLRDVQAGVEKLEIAKMSKMPAFMGERDVIKSLQLLPGVKEASQGSSGFQVRGGLTSQNLILLDGAPIYNAGHLMGLFSTFNDDALLDATLYKGLIPASFGGATSSVLDINTCPGDMVSDERFKGTASIGLLSSKASVGGPIVKGKSSYFLAARRTYFDLFLKATKNYKDTKLYFYDLNGRFDWNLSPKDRMTFSVFSAKDRMNLEDIADMTWGNRTATLKWSHQYGEKLHLSLNAYASAYDSDTGIEVLEEALTYSGFIHQGGLNAKWMWTPASTVTVDFGLQPTLYRVCTGEWDYNNYPQSERRSAVGAAGWVGLMKQFGQKLSMQAGMRLDMFSALGGDPYYEISEDGDIIETYDYGKTELVKARVNPEPRFTLNWTPSESVSVKTGYSRTTQNIHALKNDGLSMPFDRYMISSNIIKPQISDQVSIEMHKAFSDGAYELSAETYYKSIQNVLDYKDGKYISSAIELETIVKAGKGRAYGAEFSFRKNLGKLTGWLSYTLSWSENKIDGVNNGKWYTAANDRRHDISLVGMYELGRGWNASATWSYNTGQALSAPSAKYRVEGITCYYYAEKNGYRAPANHHLDLSLTNTKEKKYGERQWIFSIYNVYDRRNPYLILFTDDDTKPAGTKTVMTSLFGIVPSVSYNINF